jgi:uncharacterized delta-60 repeat protein
MRNGMFLAVASATALALAGRVAAAPGDLDPTFGTGGLVGATVSGFAEGRAVVVQPDDKIVVAATDSGDFALMRWNTDGTLDATFGGDGIVTTPIGVAAEPRALVRQPDGKLVAAGFTGASLGAETTWDFALARYEEDGDLDPTFGSGGIVIADLTGSRDLVSGLVVQPDGTLVAVGFDHFILARFLADGTLDLTFGGGSGYVVTSTGLPAGFLVGRALLRQPDGKLVAAGQFFDNAGFIGSDNFALARYHPDGTLDTSFGGDGRVYTDFPSGSENPLFFSLDEVRGVVLQPDGKIVAAGMAIGLPPPGFGGQGLRFALARYEDDGDLDPGFGEGGLVLTEFAGSAERIFGLTLQSDGKLIAVGRAHVGDNTDFALARYKANGRLDPAFGACGRATTAFYEHGRNTAHGVAVDAAGRIVAAGEIDEVTSGGSQVGVARYEGGSDLECAPSPLAGCKSPLEPGKSSLLVKDQVQPNGDRLVWKWSKGAETSFAELGDPLATTDYAFCVYDESVGPPDLVFEAAVPAGGACGKGSCWKPPTSTGFKYGDSTRRRCGVGAMKVKSGVDGKAKIVLKAKGEHVPMPALPLAVPLRAQMQSQSGTCWEATFSAAGVLKSDGTRFKARSD